MKYKLDDIEKKQIFKTPEGYFENLSSDIRKKVDSERGRTGSIFYPFLKIAVPAFALAIALYFVFIVPEKGNQQLAPDLAGYTTEEVLDFMLETGVTSNEILNVALTEDLLYETTVEEEILMEESLLDEVDWMGNYSELEIEDI